MSDSSWNKAHLCGPRAEAGALAGMVKRKVMTVEQARTLVDFPASDQAWLVAQGVSPLLVKSAARYRGLVAKEFEKLLNPQGLSDSGCKAARKCQSSRRRAAVFGIRKEKQQQPQQPPPTVARSYEEIVASVGICQNCLRSPAQIPLGNDRAYCARCFYAVLVAESA